MSLLQEAETFMGFGDTAQDVATMGADFLKDTATGSGVDTALNQGLEGHRAGDVMPGSSLLPDWATKALGPIMQGLMGAALTPKRTPTAPLGGAGHGITANTSGYDSLLKQASHLGENDPLQGLTGFKNLL